MNTHWTKWILLWKIVQRDYTRRLTVVIGLGGTFSRKIVAEIQVLVAAATDEVSAFLKTAEMLKMQLEFISEDISLQNETWMYI